MGFKTFITFVILVIVLFTGLHIWLDYHFKEINAKKANIEYTLEYKDKVYNNAKINKWPPNSYVLEDGAVIFFGNDPYVRKQE